MAKTVPEGLRDAASIYEERNKIYGDNYKQFGNLMKAIFPNGIALNTADDHNRFGIFVQILSKVTRYSQQFTKGGHKDSLDDLSVYAQMLQELDAEKAGA